MWPTSDNASYGFLVIVAWMLCPPVAAELAELPVEMPLDVDSVVLELWNADVDVDVDPDAEPAVRALPIDAESAPGALDLSFQGRTLTVQRPFDDSRKELRLRVEVTASPTLQVSLEGRDLAVTVRDARSPEELEADDEELEADDEELRSDDEELEADGEELEADGDPVAGEDVEPAADVEGSPTAASAVLRLALEDSRIDFVGTRNAVLEAIRTAVWLTRTQGSFVLNLEDGSAEVRDHQGDLLLEATETETTVHDLRGHLKPRMIGGSLDVRQGNGVFDGTATDAVVLFDAWQGYVTLEGTHTTVEARGGDQPRPWTLEGEDLLVTLDEMAGPVNAGLAGGRLVASEMAGRLALTATNGADVRLENLVRGVDLKISEGSTIRLADVSGPIKAELVDAEMQAERVGQLLLTGERSQVEVSEVRRLAGLAMSDSDLVLDLTSLTHSPSLKLLGTGRTGVRLASPCIVQVTGAPETGGSAVDVTGCDLRLQGQQGRPAAGRTVYGDRRPVTLTVALDDGVELEVEGLP